MQSPLGSALVQSPCALQRSPRAGGQESWPLNLLRTGPWTCTTLGWSLEAHRHQGSWLEGRWTWADSDPTALARRILQNILHHPGNFGPLRSYKKYSVNINGANSKFKHVQTFAKRHPMLGYTNRAKSLGPKKSLCHVSKATTTGTSRCKGEGSEGLIGAHLDFFRGSLSLNELLPTGAFSQSTTVSITEKCYDMHLHLTPSVLSKQIAAQRRAEKTSTQTGVNRRVVVFHSV